MKKFIYFLLKLSLGHLLPGFVRKKYIKKNNIKFLPTKLAYLPENNHPVIITYNWQKKLVEEYKENKKNSITAYIGLEKKLIEIFDPKQEFSFLDYGGDKIDLYLHLNDIFKNIKYFLINQKEINNIFKDLKINNAYDNLYILDDLDSINKYEFDFVFFGSVIQYIKNYTEVLDKVLKNTKKYVLISATHLYENNQNINEIIVKQINFLPKEFYLYFINLDILKKIFKKNKFQLIEKTKNNSSEINYEIFNRLKFNNLNYYNLFFKKNN
tara:strand:- start:48 stop:854 length:807 start_codon:yes stop_codon:yes gene_type:complete